MRAAVWLLGSLTSCFLATASSWAVDADIILARGKIVTVDDQFAIVEAIAISGGRILATGPTSELERDYRGANTRVVDLHGRTVVPGLIDGYIHFLRGADFWQSEVRLQGITRRSAALDALRSKAS